ncbi:MAG TPA: LysR family transcriptional regulator [Acidobacteriota bacterium]|nr:LysR family transcriptional regulator [Acidobacteriota bacterium]
MDYQALQVFLTVVEEGSFSRASERLLRTQPAVSLAVRRLEEELGETLIDRSSRDLLLTDAGRTVLDYAKRARTVERDMNNALTELRDLSAGRLTIGANESSTLYLLQHLSRFRKLYPKVRIQVLRCQSSRIPDMLLGGELELGVISYRPPQKQVVSQVIFTDHLSFICSPRHRLASHKEVSIQELGMETFIAHNVVSPYRRMVIQKFQEKRVPLNMDIEMPTVESIHKLIQRDEGVSFLPRMCVEHEIKQGTLREVGIKEIQVEREIRLVYPKKRTLSRASKAFLDLLSKDAE